MRNNSKRYVGTTEQRINKWMRMCLHWQFDIQRGIEKKSSYYFTKYHVGKYPKRFFNDLSNCVVDREYVINKMNLISEDRMKRDRKLGLNSNRVYIQQVYIPNYFDNYKIKGVKINDSTILKNVGKNKIGLSDISTVNLIKEVRSRLKAVGQHMVII